MDSINQKRLWLKRKGEKLNSRREKLSKIVEVFDSSEGTNDFIDAIIKEGTGELEKLDGEIKNNTFLEKIMEFEDGNCELDKLKSRNLQSTARKIGNLRDEAKKSIIQELSLERIANTNSQHELLTDKVFVEASTPDIVQEFLEDSAHIKSLEDPLQEQSPETNANMDILDGHIPYTGLVKFEKFEEGSIPDISGAYPHFWRNFADNSLNKEGAKKISFFNDALKSVYNSYGGEVI